MNDAFNESEKEGEIAYLRLLSEVIAEKETHAMRKATLERDDYYPKRIYYGASEEEDVQFHSKYFITDVWNLSAENRFVVETSKENTTSIQETVKDSIVALRRDTKDDIMALGRDTKDDIVAFRSDTKNDIMSLGRDTKDDIVALRRDTKDDIMALGRKTDDELAKLTQLLLGQTKLIESLMQKVELSNQQSVAQ
ncbi:hypothetical protein BGZ65_011069 [Modicella reniformis]|uniref:Uncharacterized protein n=1 Tax=Modicella reniformis TaxID=1440133 RepID=A0A9P6IUL7_9FUNG|nr:hypothetical protein BGZ65_011069 [Modicella reniformis]